MKKIIIVMLTLFISMQFAQAENKPEKRFYFKKPSDKYIRVLMKFTPTTPSLRVVYMLRDKAEESLAEYQAKEWYKKVFSAGDVVMILDKDESQVTHIDNSDNTVSKADTLSDRNTASESSTDAKVIEE